MATMAQTQPDSHTKDGSAAQSDTDAIRQLEADWQKGEQTTDIAVLQKVLADDWVNILPRGTGPSKTELISHLQPKAGQAPPYALETKDLQIHVFGDTAVAAFVKTYTAKENGNVAQEQTTHIFMKDKGVWKLRVARATVCPSEAEHP
jgi:ketosteroid isomerase-like protein